MPRMDQARRSPSAQSPESRGRSSIRLGSRPRTPVAASLHAKTTNRHDASPSRTSIPWHHLQHAVQRAADQPLGNTTLGKAFTSLPGLVERKSRGRPKAGSEDAVAKHLANVLMHAQVLYDILPSADVKEEAAADIPFVYVDDDDDGLPPGSSDAPTLP